VSGASTPLTDTSGIAWTPKTCTGTLGLLLDSPF
jgi:hypothetical protein